jgi:ABC-type multidrug transport system fused ATPase/permease subunit
MESLQSHFTVGFHCEVLTTQILERTSRNMQIQTLRTVGVVLEFGVAFLTLWMRWLTYLLFLKTFNLPSPQKPAWLSHLSMESLSFAQVLTIGFVTAFTNAIINSILNISSFVYGELSVLQLRTAITRSFLQQVGLDHHIAADLLGPKSQQIRQYLTVDQYWQEVCLIRFVVGIFLAMILSWQICILILCVFLVLIAKLTFEAMCVQKSRNMFDAYLSKWIHQALDLIGGTELIVLSGAAETEMKSLDERSDVLKTMLRQLLPKSIISIVSSSIAVNLLLPSVFLVGKLIDGDIQTFILILNLLSDAQEGYDNYTVLLNSQGDYQRALKSITHFTEPTSMTKNSTSTHGEKPEPTDSEAQGILLHRDSVELDAIEDGKDDGIVLRNVQLGYNLAASTEDADNESQAGLKVVISADLRFPPGSVIGIVGESGSGKTTLIKSLTGLLKPISGDVLVGGKSVFDDLDSWHEQISVIPQDCYLFNRTIRQNITFGNDGFSEDDLNIAADKALVLQFTSRFDEGLQTMVETGGKNLSGGQRQRVHIARALLKHSKYLIFDEPVR